MTHGANNEMSKEPTMNIYQSLPLFLVIKHIMKQYFLSVCQEGDFKQVILAAYYNNALRLQLQHILNTSKNTNEGISNGHEHKNE
jgi:hypothetical protein